MLGSWVSVSIIHEFKGDKPLGGLSPFTWNLPVATCRLAKTLHGVNGVTQPVDEQDFQVCSSSRSHKSCGLLRSSRNDVCHTHVHMVRVLATSCASEHELSSGFFNALIWARGRPKYLGDLINFVDGVHLRSPNSDWEPDEIPQYNPRECGPHCVVAWHHPSKHPDGSRDAEAPN